MFRLAELRWTPHSVIELAMSDLTAGTLAAGIWDRVINADDDALSAEEARAVLRWKFTASIVSVRMNFRQKLVLASLRPPKSTN